MITLTPDIRRLATEDADHLVFELGPPEAPMALIKVPATEDGARTAAMLAHSGSLYQVATRLDFAQADSVLRSVVELARRIYGNSLPPLPPLG